MDHSGRRCCRHPDLRQLSTFRELTESSGDNINQSIEVNNMVIEELEAIVAPRMDASDVAVAFLTGVAIGLALC